MDGELFVWIKALHVVAVISWMAGLLYLPRLFVYHCGAEPGSELSERLKVMERRLLRAIMNPAMFVAVFSGLAMAFSYTDPPVWLHVKLLCAGFLVAAHMLMAKWRKDFDADRNTRGHKFYRIANEVPTVLMVVIVIMVIVKPF